MFLHLIWSLCGLWGSGLWVQQNHGTACLEARLRATGSNVFPVRFQACFGQGRLAVLPCQSFFRDVTVYPGLMYPGQVWLWGLIVEHLLWDSEETLDTDGTFKTLAIFQVELNAFWHMRCPWAFGGPGMLLFESEMSLSGAQMFFNTFSPRRKWCLERPWSLVGRSWPQWVSPYRIKPFL